jgi:hypothetical protein
MPRKACSESTGTGKRVAAAVWNSRSYSIIQITRRVRPPRMVTIQVNNAATLI